MGQAVQTTNNNRYNIPDLGLWEDHMKPAGLAENIQIWRYEE